MIFEWRTYGFAPGRAVEYLAVFRRDGLGIVTRHLPLLGYWLTEAGRLNVLHHLWVYADLDDRAACRAALAADGDWTGGFGPRAFPMIERQESLLLVSVSGSERLSRAIAGSRRPVADDPAAPLLAASWATLEIAGAADELAVGAERVGSWQVVSGEGPGRGLALTRSDAAADLALTPREALRREILRPAGFSPLR